MGDISFRFRKDAPPLPSRGLILFREIEEIAQAREGLLCGALVL